jgi:hypothetical protein
MFPRASACTMVGHLAAALLLKKTARCFLASMLTGSLLATSSVSRNASVKHSSASAYSPLAKCLLPSSFFLAACFCSSVSFLELFTTVRLTDVLSSSARMGSGASGCNFLWSKSNRNAIIQQTISVISAPGGKFCALGMGCGKSAHTQQEHGGNCCASMEAAF